MPENSQSSPPPEGVTPEQDQLTSNRVEAKESPEKSFPSHQEIMDVYTQGDSATRLAVARELFVATFEDIGMKNGDTLDPIAEERTVSRGKITFQDSSETKPVVKFKEIRKPEKIMGLISTDRTTPTGEVLVVARIPNGKNPEDTTIVVATVKHKEGAPDIDGVGVFEVMNEETFNKLQEEHASTITGKRISGEIGIDDYLKAYEKKNNGVSLMHHQRRRDEQIRASGNIEQIKESREALLQQVQERHEKVLQESSDEIEMQVRETEIKRAQLREKRAEVADSREFQLMMQQFLIALKTKKDAGTIAKWEAAIQYNFRELFANSPRSLTAEMGTLKAMYANRYERDTK